MKHPGNQYRGIVLTDSVKVHTFVVGQPTTNLAGDEVIVMSINIDSAYGHPAKKVRICCEGSWSIKFDNPTIVQLDSQWDELARLLADYRVSTMDTGADAEERRDKMLERIKELRD